MPSCAENDSLLGFTGRHDRFGDMAREILNAELIYSGGQINGRFYVDECNNGYSCVFVFGELLKLKEIKESGEIAKYLNLDNTFLWADGQCNLERLLFYLGDCINIRYMRWNRNLGSWTFYRLLVSNIY